MAPSLPVLITFAGLVNLYMLQYVIRHAWAAGAQLHWACSRAVVVAAERVPNGVDEPDRYHLQARLRTLDGRELVGWARDDHPPRARRRIGHEVDAWYDPDDPWQFRLSKPETRLGAALSGALMMLPFLVFLGVLCAIYYLES